LSEGEHPGDVRILLRSHLLGKRLHYSAGTNRTLVPPVTSTTVGSRAFPVAASLIWNSLPDDVISAESLPTFQRKLKRHLFCQSFRGFGYWHLHLQWTLQWQCHLGHSKILWLIDWLITRTSGHDPHIIQTAAENISVYEFTDQVCTSWLFAGLCLGNSLTYLLTDDELMRGAGRAIRYRQSKKIDTRPASVAMQWVHDGGRRRRGRPGKTWRQTFQEDLQEMRVSWSGLHRVACDRSASAGVGV